MVRIRQAASGSEIDAARSLMHEYQALLGVDLSFQGFEEELRGLPGAYAPPRGRLLLADHDEGWLGCVALRDAGAGRCEMKRLFVRPSARGLGVGRALVVEILGQARLIGYDEMVLDTLPMMADAQRLYESFGFRDIPPYRENPIAGTRYLAKDLRGGAPGDGPR